MNEACGHIAMKGLRTSWDEQEPTRPGGYVEPDELPVAERGHTPPGLRRSAGMSVSWRADAEELEGPVRVAGVAA
jgi:hypothetical protein